MFRTLHLQSLPNPGLFACIYLELALTLVLSLSFSLSLSLSLSLSHTHTHTHTHTYVLFISLPLQWNAVERHSGLPGPQRPSLSPFKEQNSTALATPQPLSVSESESTEVIIRRGIMQRTLGQELGDLGSGSSSDMKRSMKPFKGMLIFCLWFFISKMKQI